MACELLWCGQIRVFMRPAEPDGPIRGDGIEVMVFTGDPGGKLHFHQRLAGLDADPTGYQKAARVALVAMMKSTPRGCDLRSIKWSSDGPELESKMDTGKLRELAVKDFEILGRKGWDVT